MSKKVGEIFSDYKTNANIKCSLNFSWSFNCNANRTKWNTYASSECKK